MQQQRFFLHLVSDSTGSTLYGSARACVAQFPDVEPVEKFWNFVRTKEQLEDVIKGIEENPGPVLYTMVEPELGRHLTAACRKLSLPCLAVLDPVLKVLSNYLEQTATKKPGMQYKLTEKYFERIDAVDFAMHHDDGQALETIGDADVILVGVSRTSKTPTCMYLANRGVRAANIPLAPNITYPEEAFSHPTPLYVGLVENPNRLVELRRTRLNADDEATSGALHENAYLDPEAVSEEVREARKLFSRKSWPVIDVTRRSVEETAAEILMLLNRRIPESDQA